MTTKEFQKRLRELGRSAEGQRNVLIKRYEKYAARESQEEIGEDRAVPEGGSHDVPEASEADPMPQLEAVTAPQRCRRLILMHQITL